MSLDVYLEMDAGGTRTIPAKIFVLENGSTREITRDEWDARFPGTEPVMTVPRDERETREVYSANITHNLNDMADEAGIYRHLWRPDELGITKASELILPLREGLALLRADPERFKKHNPKNGWGNYEGLVEFVAGYLSACEEYPDAKVLVVLVWR